VCARDHFTTQHNTRTNLGLVELQEIHLLT
jgi:hypothetical protein